MNGLPPSRLSMDGFAPPPPPPPSVPRITLFSSRGELPRFLGVKARFPRLTRTSDSQLGSQLERKRERHRKGERERQQSTPDDDNTAR